MRVAAVQVAPVLLDRDATLQKIITSAQDACERGARVVVFPEALLPGYPAWLSSTGGARFNDPLQKELHARYVDQSIELPGPELERLQELARELEATLIVGVMERGRRAGRGTLWCSALTIHPSGEWRSHRKLVPTYEERLAWSRGDGHGLVVDDIDGWRVGALNCWENWMPATRLSMYAQGTEVHCSLWPGAPELTTDISRFTAREGRVYVVAASAVLHAKDLPEDLPGRDLMIEAATDGLIHRGGSRIVAPTGETIASLDDPVEGVLVADVRKDVLLGERQNFDPTGHYGRDDVFHLDVNRQRVSGVRFVDEG